MPHLEFPTAFGTCALAWNEVGLTRFWLPESAGVPKEGAVAPPDWIRELVKRVQLHLGGNMQDFSDVPIDWSKVGSFQQAVYRQTVAIKAGQKKSYGDIARALALGPESARAVGAALGANPWPLVVPCHRVVSATDKMTGFSGPGGVRTKTRLLVLEGAELLSE